MNQTTEPAGQLVTRPNGRSELSEPDDFLKVRETLTRIER